MELSVLQRLALFARHRYRAVFLGFAVLLAVCGRSDPAARLRHRHAEPPAARTTRRCAPTSRRSRTSAAAPTCWWRSASRRARWSTPTRPWPTGSPSGWRRLPELKTVQHKIGEPRELLETFYPKALLFLDEAGRRKLEERLSDEGIRAARERAPAPALARRRAWPPRSCCGSIRSAWPTCSSAGSSPPAARLQVDWTSGYYLSRDHRLLLILAEPVRPPQDIEFAERLAAKVDRVVAEADRQSGERSPGRSVKAPEVVVGGPHLTALGDAGADPQGHDHEPRHRGAQRAAVLLVHLPAAGHPHLRAAARCSPACSSPSASPRSRWARSARRRACVAALLVGLGIDFVIVSYGRYIEERQQGATWTTRCSP